MFYWKKELRHVGGVSDMSKKPTIEPGQAR